MDMVKLAFYGSSFAARHLRADAIARGFTVVDGGADVAFVCEDAPTNADGKRDATTINAFLEDAIQECLGSAVVVTSQVEPGFMRRLSTHLRCIGPLYHQAETLRVKDARERARNPEMIVIGCADPTDALPPAYEAYVRSFGCPVLTMSYEEAEFAKIAINCTLAVQVDCANRLSAAASKVGASWEVIANVLRHDSRIGPRAYLTPGRWQDSPHLLRDDYTLRRIEECTPATTSEPQPR